MAINPLPSLVNLHTFLTLSLCPLPILPVAVDPLLSLTIGNSLFRLLSLAHYLLLFLAIAVDACPIRSLIPVNHWPVVAAPSRVLALAPRKTTDDPDVLF